MIILIVAFLMMIITGGGYMYLISRNQETTIAEPTDTEGEAVWWGLEDPAIYRDLISDFESQNPNTKIIYERQSPIDYRQRLKEALARGEGPDIYSFHNTWVPMFRNDLDVMPSFVMNTSDFSNIYYPVMVSDLTTNEGIVGIPLEYDGLTFYINEEIMANAGKTPPETWDELRGMVGQLSQKDSRGVISQSGIPLGFTENIDHWQEIVAFMILQNFAVPTKPDSERARDALLYYRSFAQEGVWDSTLPPSTVAFGQGTVAMYFGTVESTVDILKQNPNLFFKSVPVPQLRKDNPDDPDVAYASYWVQGVARKSNVRGVSWRFLNFMSQPESLQKIFQNATSVKGIGDPYPRVDMSSLQDDDPIIGSVIKLAPNARSWYLADKTYDGEQGINTRIGEIFRRLISSGLGRGANIAAYTAEIATVLAEYGVVVKK